MKIFKCAVALTALVASMLSSRAELIPAVRLTDWTPGVRVGVAGGIPTNRTRVINVTQLPYSADNTGHSNAGAAIQAAINNAGANDVVYLPAGTYKMEAALSLGQAKDHVTLRGAGMGQTVLAIQSGVSVPIQVGTGFSFNYPANGEAILGGNHKDSAVLSVKSTADFAVNSTIMLMFEEQRDEAAIRAGAVPIASVTGFNYADSQSPLIQISKVVSKTATTLTISPSIIRQHDAGLAAKAFTSPWNNAGIGVEDLTIDCSAGEVFAGVFLQNANDCWVKGVKVVQSSNYGIYLQFSVNCELRQNDIRTRKGNGTNGSGILVNGTSSCLFEDNIVADIFPNLEVNQGSNGNVFAYNLFENSPKNGYLFDTIYSNHGPHNTHNLYEGNITANVKSDGYFGGASEDTLFRNWFHGTYQAKNQFTYITSLNRFTRNYSLVGNILGTGATPGGGSPYSMGNPNIGNGGFVGAAAASDGDFWVNWNTTATLAARTSDTDGKITVSSGTLHHDTSTAYPQYITLRFASNGKVAANVQAATQNGSLIAFHSASAPLPPAGTALTVWWGSAGYQEKDLDVAKTTILKANYNAIAGKIAANEALGADSLPNSLYMSSKPAWFGGLAWPAINALSPHAAIKAAGAGNLSEAYKMIPAGYRFVTGIDPVTGKPVTDETPPAVIDHPAAATGIVSPTIKAPVIAVQPTSQTVASHAAVVLSVTASDVETCQWKKNGINVAGWNTVALSLSGVSINDNGVYTVVVGNSSGSVTSNPAVLTVTAQVVQLTEPVVSVPAVSVPVISSQPNNQSVAFLGTARFSISATNAASYQWQRNGISIPGWNAATLTIVGTSSNDVGTYSVVVSNANGSVTSSAAQLMLTAAGTNPTPVTPTPVVSVPVISSQPSNQSAAFLGTATFSVTATDAISYQWQKNGISIAGWNTATLTLIGASSNDVATYTVVVTNAYGSVSSLPVQLMMVAAQTVPTPPITVPPVVSAPVISSQPTNQSVAFLGTATFNVSATHATSYQWKRNGISFPGWNTATLTIAGASSNDVGTYTVVVTNAYGSVSSLPVQLLMN